MTNSPLRLPDLFAKQADLIERRDQLLVDLAECFVEGLALSGGKRASALEVVTHTFKVGDLLIEISGTAGALAHGGSTSSVGRTSEGTPAAGSAVADPAAGHGGVA